MRPAMMGAARLGRRAEGTPEGVIAFRVIGSLRPPRPRTECAQILISGKI